MFKLSLRLLAISILLPAVLLGGWLIARSRPAASPSVEVVRESRERAITWLVENRIHVLGSLDVVAWRLLHDSHRRIPDPRMLELFQEFRGRFDTYPGSPPWQPFFDVNAKIPKRFLDSPDWKGPTLQNWILAGLTCNAEMLDRTRELLDRGLCPVQLLRTGSCASRQLVALATQRDSGCRPAAELDPLIAHLQQTVEQELLLNPIEARLLERVLSVLESGSPRWKPIWIKNVLSAQYEDGSWGRFEAFLPLPDDRAIGIFAGKLIRIKAPVGDFTSTAMAIRIMTLWLEDSKRQPVARQSSW